MTDRHLEFVTQLFKGIQLNADLPAQLSSILSKLQSSIYTLCKSDQKLISNSKHPARQTVALTNKLCQLAQSDSQLIHKLCFILDNLLDSSLSLQNYMSTNQRLQQLINQHSLSTSNTINTTHSILDTKSHLQDKIKLCIQGREIPSSCKLLVLKLWPSALLHLLKAHGEKTRHWNNAIDMYCELLDSIQPIHNIDQYRSLKDNYLRIAKSHNNMLLLYHEESSVEPAIKALISFYNHQLGSTSFGEAIQNMNRISILDRISSLPDDVRPGVWCELFIDDGIPRRRLKLSFINFETGMLIFVNRNGVKKLEKDALDFSQELNKGLSQIFSHDALFKPRSMKQRNKEASQPRKIS